MIEERTALSAPRDDCEGQAQGAAHGRAETVWRKPVIIFREYLFAAAFPHSPLAAGLTVAPAVRSLGPVRQSAVDGRDGFDAIVATHTPEALLVHVEPVCRGPFPSPLAERGSEGDRVVLNGDHHAGVRRHRPPLSSGLDSRHLIVTTVENGVVVMVRSAGEMLPSFVYPAVEAVFAAGQQLCLGTVGMPERYGLAVISFQGLFPFSVHQTDG